MYNYLYWSYYPKECNNVNVLPFLRYYSSEYVGEYDYIYNAVKSDFSEKTLEVLNNYGTFNETCSCRIYTREEITKACDEFPTTDYAITKLVDYVKNPTKYEGYDLDTCDRQVEDDAIFIVWFKTL